MILGWSIHSETLQKSSTQLEIKFRQPKLHFWLYGVGFVLAGLITSIFFLFSMFGKTGNLWSDIFGAFLFPLFFIITGFLFMVLSSQIIICTFDKDLGSVTIKRKSLIGEKIRRCSSREIYDVQIEETEGEDGTASRVTLVQTSGAKLPLTWFYNYGSVEDKQEILARIRDFLNLQ